MLTEQAPGVPAEMESRILLANFRPVRGLVPVCHAAGRKMEAGLEPQPDARAPMLLTIAICTWNRSALLRQALAQMVSS
jgi:hypothetical protein